MPELQDSSVGWDSFYRGYIRSYLERDVRDLINVRDERRFYRFLVVAASRTGQLFNASSVANEVEVDATTVKGWLSVLEASGIVRMLRPFWSNLGKRLTKTPKLYFMFYGWTRPNGGYNYATKRLTVTGDLLSSTNDNSVTTYAANYLSALTTYTINYWLEDANDTGYTKSAAYSQEAQAASGANWSAKQITGFTYISTTPDGYPSSSGTEIDFYYTRDTYSLTFSSYGTVDKTVSSIKFGADVSNDDYTPTCPPALAGYTFDGWYTTSDCLEGTEYNFASATMQDVDVKAGRGRTMGCRFRGFAYRRERYIDSYRYAVYDDTSITINICQMGGEEADGLCGLRCGVQRAF